MTLSKRASLISPSPTLAITAKAKAMKAEGVDIIGFGAGDKAAVIRFFHQVDRWHVNREGHVLADTF